MTRKRSPKDPDQSSSTENEEGNLGKDLSKNILANIRKSFTGEDTSRFLINLGDTFLTQPPEADNQPGEEVNGKEARSSVLYFLDKLFDDFVRYSYEFGKTPTGERFSPECLRPVRPQDPFQPTPGELPILLEGSLAIGDWAMLVQVQGRKIRAFVIPRPYLQGFHSRQSYYTPFFELESSFEHGEYGWKLDGAHLDSEFLPKISKDLFAALVKIAKGEASHTEKFRLDSGVRDPGETLHRINQFETQGINVRDLGAPISLRLGKETPQEAQRRSCLDNLARELEDNEDAILSSCDTFLLTLDRELDRLRKISDDASAQEDAGAVERAAIRSRRLDSFRQAMLSLVIEWQTLASGIDVNRR
jgi:hypothetical protein